MSCVQGVQKGSGDVLEYMPSAFGCDLCSSLNKLGKTLQIGASPEQRESRCRSAGWFAYCAARLSLFGSPSFSFFTSCGRSRQPRPGAAAMVSAASRWTIAEYRGYDNARRRVLTPGGGGGLAHAVCSFVLLSSCCPAINGLQQTFANTLFQYVLPTGTRFHLHAVLFLGAVQKNSQNAGPLFFCLSSSLLVSSVCSQHAKSSAFFAK